MRRRASRRILDEIPRDPGTRPSRSYPAHGPHAHGLARWLLCLGRPAERDRSVQNRTLLAEILMIHRASRETYGSPSIWDALIKRGRRVGEHRIARLMRADGIRAKTVKKWRATTDSGHPPQPPVPGRAAQPGVGRGAHVRVDDGGLAVPRRGARSVLAHCDRLGDGPPADRASGQRALNMALVKRTPTAGLLHHSDRGSQYAAHRYRRLLDEYLECASPEKCPCSTLKPNISSCLF